MACPCLRKLGVRELENQRVAIGPGHGGEAPGGVRVAVKCDLEIGRRHRRAGRRIGGRPSAVFLRCPDLSQACIAHPPRLDQFRRALPVDLRPARTRPTRREAEEEEALVPSGALTVDPAFAERGVDRVLPGEADRVHARSRKHQPSARRCFLGHGQPRREACNIGMQHDRKAVLRLETVRFAHPTKDRTTLMRTLATRQ